MGTATKKIGMFTALKNIFSSGIDVEDYSDYVLPKELASAQKALEVKENEVKKGFNSSKGGFRTKINPKTEEAMRAMHSKVAKKETKTADIEIGD